MTDTIANLQAAIVTILTTTATDLTGLVVVTSDDILAESKIEAALAGVGLCAVVISPDIEFTPPRFLSAKPYIRVIENVRQNRSAAGTSYAGSYWAIHMAAWLWGVSVGEEWDYLQVRSITQDAGTEQTLEWVITLETSGAFTTESDPAPTPPAPES